jgi:hypothetical protein
VPLRSVPEIYSEFTKSLHTLGNVNNKTVMNRQTYDQANEPQWGNTISTYTYGSSAISGTNISIAGNSVTLFSAATPSVITCTSTVGFEVGQPIYFIGAATTVSAIATPTFGGTAGSNPVPGNATNTPTIYYIASILSGTTFTMAANPYGFSVFGCGTGSGAIAAGSLYVVQKDYYVQQTPSFLMGLNLETMYQATNNSMSGINTNSGNVFLNSTYSAATPSGGQRFDCWSHYDFMIMIDPRSKQMSIRI